MSKRFSVLFAGLAAAGAACGLAVSTAGVAADPKPAAAAPAKPAAVKPAGKPAAKAATPQWLWAAKSASESGTAILRKEFTVDARKLKSATLVVAIDNAAAVLLDGKPVGRNDAWDAPTRIDLTRPMKPGTHELTLDCKNSEGAAGQAGAVCKLTLAYADGSVEELVSDASWQAAKTSAGPFAAASVIAPLGDKPWGDVFTAAVGEDQATPVEAITVPAGFTVDLVYSVPKGAQGSWVSLTTDPQGRLIACDQYGGLYRIVPGAPGKEAETTIEPIDVELGDAQGLLCAFDSLYVVVNGGGNGKPGSGLYRVRDTDGDDKYDAVEPLQKFEGAGEHGPHAVRLGPDGKLWVIAGNHTNPPAVVADSPFRGYEEDLFLKRNPDGNGHATGRMAPAGWVASTDKDGKAWSLFCGGFRNPYDFAFNADGERFVYDADMEWDTGTPWYRPTRVNHAVSAAEFGWRYGTGKWPAYDADSVGAVVDIGLGSPTGVEFGYGTKFPAQYQHALFIEDWTYGKIYAVHMQPQGASYTASFETFAEGRPFPVTDLTVNPKDGCLYVTIGGRKTQSGLYRIRYTGDESTAAAPVVANERAAKARAIRRSLEAFHGKPDPKAVPAAWPHLASADRAIRYAARVAVERQPLGEWKDKALAETRIEAVIQSAIALCRAGSALPDGEKRALQAQVLAKLNALPLARMTEERTLDACRAYQLAFIRLGGKPDAALVDQVIAKVDPLMPAGSEFVNREALKLLVYLEAPSAVEKGMSQLAAARTQQEQMFYVFTLRTLQTGWTPEARRGFFGWLNYAAKNGRGGNSFVKFLNQIREDAKAVMTPEQVAAVADVIEGKVAFEPVGLDTSRQFVHNWQLADFAGDLPALESGRSFEKGREVYLAAQCAKCHRFAGDGGDTGPDVTGVGARFSPQYLLESLVEPSKAVSDQYRNVVILTTAGEVVTGRVINETADTLFVRTDPFARELTQVKKSDVEEQQLSPTSEMPQGLINSLTKEEILDLLAYLRSAGNPQDKAFAPQK